jgi:hypothetical protein
MVRTEQTVSAFTETLVSQETELLSIFHLHAMSDSALKECGVPLDRDWG